MSFWRNLGEGSLTKTVGGLIDSGFGALQSWQNFQYGERAADAADRRQREQFKDLYSLEAQMEQIKNAGLSPSMFFSGGLSGQGGASAPQGNGANGPIFNSSPINLQAMAAAREMDSQTNLNNAQAKLIGEQTITQQWENWIKAETAEYDITKAMLELDSLLAQTKLTNAEAEGQEFSNELNKENREELSNQIKYKTTNMILDMALSVSKVDLNYAQIRKYEAEIQEMFLRLQKDVIDSQINYSKIQAEVINLFARLNIDIKKLENDTKRVGIENKHVYVESQRVDVEREKNETEKDRIQMEYITRSVAAVMQVAGIYINHLLPWK